MGKLNLDHWFVKDNTLSISLMNLFVDISVMNDDDTIKVRVVDSNMEELALTVDTLGEAIFFTENEITKCRSLKEVEDEYKNTFNKSTVKKVTSNKIILTPEEVDQAILDYFGTNKNYRVSIKEKLTIVDDKPDITFYLTEHLDFQGIRGQHEIRLSEEDIKKSLDSYVNYYNYELEDYKYLGGIHKTGYYLDEDTPHYDGVQLNVKKKDKKLTLKRK